MTTAAPPHASRRPVASIVWFVFMCASWVVFAVLLAGDELSGILDAVGDAPLVLEVLWWILGLPWLLAASIWESGWEEPVRIAAVLAVALGWTWLSWPRRIAGAKG